MDFVPIDPISTENFAEGISVPVIPQLEVHHPELLSPKPNLKFSKQEIRTSLEASTTDSVFAAIFSNITGGVLLTNFLMDLGASPTEIGLLASIPMLANLVQPVGAYFSEQTTSRHLYCLWIYGSSRLLWLILTPVVFLLNGKDNAPHFLIALTLGIALLSYFLGALGSAPWLSWMAVLVPRRLRGRYFGFRNSAANLTNLISIPLMGLLISKWFGGSLEGYSIVLILGIVSGLISLWFQNYMVDVNPQQLHSQQTQPHQLENKSTSGPLSPLPAVNIFHNPNCLIFLLYFSLWMFAVNLSAPFFNLYMLDNLSLDITQVTLYNSLMAGANLLMLMLWGKLADKIGNRLILILVGILVAGTPILWLLAGTNSFSLWFWLPLLHILMGGTLAAIDLCSNNLQIGVAPLLNQSTYFGIVAALAGVSGALGTTVGGYLAQFGSYSGVFGLFALSGILRLGSLFPLFFVREQR